MLVLKERKENTNGIANIAGNLAGALRLCTRLLAFLLVVSVCVGVALVYRFMDFVWRRQLDRSSIARRMLSLLYCSLGMRVHVQGEPSAVPCLQVSNHISWADIPVLGGQVPLRFLSKKEVGDWPVIGWLAQEAGTLFIERRAGKAGQVKQDIQQVLESGQRVLLFPEGTTTDGRQVRKFHSKLMQAAMDAWVPVQPVTVAYLRDGKADRLAPFVGDDGFFKHLLCLLQQPPMRIEIIYHPSIEPRFIESANEVSHQSHADVEAGLHQLLYGDLRRDEVSASLPGSSGLVGSVVNQ